MIEAPTLEEKRVFFKIKNILASDPTSLGYPNYLGYHWAKFDTPMKADPANGIVGGWAATFRLEWIVGWVRFALKTNGKYKLLFGQMPKSSAGKNEWVEILCIDDVEESSIHSTLDYYDDITKPVIIPGALTSTQAKKRRRK